MIKKISLLVISLIISTVVNGSLPEFQRFSRDSDSLKNHTDSLEYLANNNLLDSLEKTTFVTDFFRHSLDIFFNQKDAITAWKVCIADDSLRKVNVVLQRTASYLNRNKHKTQYLKNEFKNTESSLRATLLHRTWWTDSLKSNFDSLGNSSGFITLGIDIKEVKKSIIDDMKNEASAPQFVESLINSGRTAPKKVAISSDYCLYKIIPKGNLPPSPFTPFWTKIEDLKASVSDNLEQKFGLPIVSHSAKYDVYRIQLKEGKTALIFESEIAETTENTYKTSGGGWQSLVLDRTKWTSPVLVTELEMFPPFKK